MDNTKLVDRLRHDYAAQMRTGKPAPQAWAAAKENASLDRTVMNDNQSLVSKTTNAQQNLRADQALVKAGIGSTTYRNDMGIFRTYVNVADAERAKAVVAQAEARYQATQQEMAKSGMGLGIGV